MLMTPYALEKSRIHEIIKSKESVEKWSVLGPVCRGIPDSAILRDTLSHRNCESAPRRRDAAPGDPCRDKPGRSPDQNWDPAPMTAGHYTP